MSDFCIEVVNVSKSFKLFHGNAWKVIDFIGLPVPSSRYTQKMALDDITMQMKKGERVGLVGRNGAGKTTLLNIICQRLMPSKGKVIVNGNIQSLMVMGMGLHYDFTGRQNIYSSLANHGIGKRKAESLVEEIIDFAEIGEYIDEPMKTYSSGMGARLAFAIATAWVPDILIVDEILGVGDAYFAAKSTARMLDLTVNKARLFYSSAMTCLQWNDCVHVLVGLKTAVSF